MRANASAYANAEPLHSGFDEKTPLLDESNEKPFPEAQTSRTWLIPKRISEAVIGTVKALLATVIAPGKFVIACFHDEEGHFSVLSPVYKISRTITRKERKSRKDHKLAKAYAETNEKERPHRRRSSVAQSKTRRPRRSPSIASTSTAVTSDSEIDSERPLTIDEETDSPSRHTRSKSSASGADRVAPAQRTMHIRLTQPEEVEVRQRRKKNASRSNVSKNGSSQVSAEAAAALKSPTSPATVSAKQLTKFPRAPQPPRPLVPRRQPSYSTAGASAVGPYQKTLIIDLDETLIHSMSKGGRYTTGHMVEVKLSQPVGADGQVVGPQIPILYYVHFRPHWDEFLKKVCKWYNLVIFTAAVQEYADPVIDLLEKERKYFSGRYYRQHCTFRNGSYIKDLSQVEPDLSKVMIIDNSPISYAFNEDNAIPIEGWINDPTDNHLLHLVPLLEGLQYATDVRALLALRSGEPQHIS
ncbi:NIF domain-containing protein [Aaosphaeria arxii CBS 175.79]|uniref:NIF domain-containing protein n=1 Tax=Aaosphaeria arxii CBS 175.79 TaxID=1450172 RepID=A0A6A5XZE5_9PLEO|nr:NIF domain-containing protein [Aaosphaeria arxii CBS 175.79]KAF2018187.1 NIF domain-containing protein [Aaosphaeria arxii CBS 175.79]